MNVHPKTLERLKKRLQNLQRINNLDAHRALVLITSKELGMDTLDFAATLLQMTHPHLFETVLNNEPTPPIPERPKAVNPRSVRYRLDVGRSHHAKEDEILKILIEESGVDRKRITRLEMREDFTLVDLPDGMPADIFQLLSESCIQGRALNLKRLKPNRKKLRSPR